MVKNLENIIYEIQYSEYFDNLLYKDNEEDCEDEENYYDVYDKVRIYNISNTINDCIFTFLKSKRDKKYYPIGILNIPNIGPFIFYDEKINKILKKNINIDYFYYNILNRETTSLYVLSKTEGNNLNLNAEKLIYLPIGFHNIADILYSISPFVINTKNKHKKYSKKIFYDMYNLCLAFGHKNKKSYNRYEFYIYYYPSELYIEDYVML